ncbi:hypothetical protein STA3757_29870 [Stanieria sp. NIES-3757]|nr:hypothetical protein STA3757_29870 [Stanieria sp. NIES-3757]
MTTEDYSDKSIDSNQTSSETGLSQPETIELLTESIRQLERVVEHLKVRSTKNLPSASVNKLAEITKVLATTVNNLDKIEEIKTIAIPDPTSSVVKPLSSEVKSTSQRAVKRSKNVNQSSNNWLNKIRSNLVLTGIVATGIILVISTSIFWLSHQPTETKLAVQPTPIPEENSANFEELVTPPSSETPPKDIDSSETEEKSTVVIPEVTIPSQPITITTTSPEKINSSETEEKSTVVIPEVTIPSQPITVTTTSPEKINSPKPEAEEKPEVIIPEEEKSSQENLTKPSTKIPPAIVTLPEVPVETETLPAIETSPTEQLETPQISETKPQLPPENFIQPKPLPLTPEQNLVAAISTKLSDISNQYFDDLVLSVEANFLQSNLLVKVSDHWYNLNQSEQDKFANEILQKSQQLDFKKLAIQDTSGKLIARTPVVGKQIIILQRTNNNV